MSHEQESERGGAFTRRNFLYGAASTAALSLPLDSPAAAARRLPSPGNVIPGGVAVTLRINGRAYPLSIDSRTTLLDAIRDHAGLMGTKKGCGHGQCGACTVHLDGRRVLACLTFAVMSTGHEVTTIGSERAGCATASHATGVHRSRRVQVRLLHARTDHVGGRMCPRGPCRGRAPDSRIYERQYLLLRGLSEHRRSDRTGQDGQLRRH